MREGRGGLWVRGARSHPGDKGNFRQSLVPDYESRR